MVAMGSSQAVSSTSHHGMHEDVREGGAAGLLAKLRRLGCTVLN